MKAIYFVLFCASIGIAYATPLGNKPGKVTRKYLGEYVKHYDEIQTPEDGIQSVKFAYNEIVKKYPNIFITGDCVARLNKNNEINELFGEFTMLDVVSEDEACKIFCDILSMYASAMKRYKTINHPLCKNFGIRNIRLHISFRPAVNAHSRCPKIESMQKEYCDLIICSYDDSQDADPCSPNIKFVHFCEMWKKYAGKK